MSDQSNDLDTENDDQEDDDQKDDDQKDDDQKDDDQKDQVKANIEPWEKQYSLKNNAWYTAWEFYGYSKSQLDEFARNLYYQQLAQQELQEKNAAVTQKIQEQTKQIKKLQNQNKNIQQDDNKGKGLRSNEPQKIKTAQEKKLQQQYSKNRGKQLAEQKLQKQQQQLNRLQLQKLSKQAEKSAKIQLKSKYLAQLIQKRNDPEQMKDLATQVVRGNHKLYLSQGKPGLTPEQQQTIIKQLQSQFKDMPQDKYQAYIKGVVDNRVIDPAIYNQIQHQKTFFGKLQNSNFVESIGVIGDKISNAFSYPKQMITNYLNAAVQQQVANAQVAKGASDLSQGNLSGLWEMFKGGINSKLSLWQKQSAANAVYAMVSPFLQAAGGIYAIKATWNRMRLKKDLQDINKKKDATPLDYVQAVGKAVQSGQINLKPKNTILNNQFTNMIGNQIKNQASLALQTVGKELGSKISSKLRSGTVNIASAITGTDANVLGKTRIRNLQEKITQLKELEKNKDLQRKKLQEEQNLGFSINVMDKTNPSIQQIGNIAKKAIIQRQQLQNLLIQYKIDQQEMQRKKIPPQIKNKRKKLGFMRDPGLVYDPKRHIPTIRQNQPIFQKKKQSYLELIPAPDVNINIKQRQQKLKPIFSKKKQESQFLESILTPNVNIDIKQRQQKLNNDWLTYGSKRRQPSLQQKKKKESQFLESILTPNVNIDIKQRQQSLQQSLNELSSMISKQIKSDKQKIDVEKIDMEQKRRQSDKQKFRILSGIDKPIIQDATMDPPPKKPLPQWLQKIRKRRKTDNIIDEKITPKQ